MVNEAMMAPGPSRSHKEWEHWRFMRMVSNRLYGVASPPALLSQYPGQRRKAFRLAGKRIVGHRPGCLITKGNIP